MSVIEFEILDLPKTYNAMGRKHWAVKANEARKWKLLVAAATATKRPDKPMGRASLTLTRFSSVSPDPDGLASSFKHVVDGLRFAGVIEDDKFQNIGMPKYQWERCKRGEGKIRVKVEAA